MVRIERNPQNHATALTEGGTGRVGIAALGPPGRFRGPAHWRYAMTTAALRTGPGGRHGLKELYSTECQICTRLRPVRFRPALTL